MPYIQENKTYGYWNGKKVGIKEQTHFSITIPKEIIKEKAWKKGDKIKFVINQGYVILKKEK